MAGGEKETTGAYNQYQSSASFSTASWPTARRTALKYRSLDWFEATRTHLFIHHVSS